MSAVKVRVEQARAVEPFECASDVDAFIAPSGTRFDYRIAKIVEVHGHPTMWDEICFVRHIARRTAGVVRVLGVSLGGARRSSLL